MLYPRLHASQTTRQMIDTFRGYNHNLRVADGEFYEMENMTSDFYPVLSPRGKRGIYKSCEGLTGIIAKDSLCYVDGSGFVIGDTRVEMGLDEGTQKELVSMGAYVIIMPDKKYINTIEPDDRGDIEASYVSSGSVTFRLCSQVKICFARNCGSPSAWSACVISARFIDLMSCFMPFSSFCR